MRVLLIIPAYNEESNIKSTVEKIIHFHPTGTYQLSYLVINDGSTDKTEQICRENGYHCLSLIQNLGIGGAVQSGYLYARKMGYDIAVQFDGDGQHDIQSLDTLLDPLIAGKADFCIGSRFLKQTGAFRSTAVRRMGIRYLSSMIRILSGTRIFDPTSGFRAASAPVISYLAVHYPADYPEPESIIMLLKNGFSVSEVPVRMFCRSAGKSSINFKRSIYYMFKVSLAMVCIWMQGGKKNVAVSQN